MQAPDVLYTLDDVKSHSSREDCWIVVSGVVLNLTGRLHEIPCNEYEVLVYAGRDGSEELEMICSPDELSKYAIGRVGTATEKTAYLVRLAKQREAEGLPLIAQKNALSKRPGMIKGGNVSGVLLRETMTIEAAKQRAAAWDECRGFCFRGDDTTELVEVIFKDRWETSPRYEEWISYCKDPHYIPDEVYTMDEVASRIIREDCWTVAYGLVLNLTGHLHEFDALFMSESQILNACAGRDGTEEFEVVSQYFPISEYALSKYAIGRLGPAAAKAACQYAM